MHCGPNTSWTGWANASPPSNSWQVGCSYLWTQLAVYQIKSQESRTAMINVAIKMLFGDRVKLLGILLGVTMATVLITQQGGLFFGLMTRAQNVIAEAGDVDIWVMHPTTEQFNLAKPIFMRDVMKVRGLDDVAWASPLVKANLVVAGASGRSRSALLIGLDDVTLAAAPRKFVHGSLEDLRRPDAIAIDRVGFMKLWPNEAVLPGKALELNDRRAVVVAITDAAPAFSANVIIHTRRSLALSYAPTGRRSVSYIVAGVTDGADIGDTAAHISAVTGLIALTSRAFSDATVDYYLRHTGITINFATTIILGIIVGMAIVGLTFGLFVTDNLSHYAVLKMLGVSNRQLVLMVVSQVGLIALIGYALGIGLAAGFFELVSAPTSALRGFYLPWWMPLTTLAIMAIAVLVSTMMGLRRVLVVDPALVFRGPS